MNELNVLLVEDDAEDALVVRQLLGHPTLECRFTVRVVERLKDALSALEAERFDVVLLDLMLPDSRGIATFLEIRSEKPEAPVLVLSGLDSESLALEACRLGAQDYLTKGTLDGPSLARAIGYAIQRGHWVRDLERLIDGSPDGMAVVDLTGVVRYVNAAASRLLGKAPEELLGRAFERTLPPTGPETIALGTSWIELRVADLEWAKEPARLVSLRDVSTLRRLEDVVQELEQRRSLDELKDHVMDALLTELRSPLSESFAALEVMRRGGASAGFESLRDALEKLSRLVSSIPSRVRRAPERPAAKTTRA